MSDQSSHRDSLPESTDSGSKSDASSPAAPEQDTGALTTVLESKAATKNHNVFSRLSTGTGAFDIIGHRRWYYVFSACLLLLSILFMLVRGFNLSLEFVGGTQLTLSPTAASTVSHSDVTEVIHEAIGVETESVVDVASDIEVSLPKIDQDQVETATQALVAAFDLSSDVTKSDVSGTWGNTVSKQAIISVIVFLIAVAIFIGVRYEHRVATGAVVSVIHDLIVAAGVYSLIGFEVAPATVIGLLTILGFSLYDTVVVYDRVEENVKGLTSLLRRTFSEGANLAINQTLMRSINTSLIALLPVAGLLTAGIAILGSGTLKDLSLIMLCGMMIGAYSSVFLAVPMAVDLKMRQPAIRHHTKRVLAKREAEGLIVDADGDPIGRRAVVQAADGTTMAPRQVHMPGAQAEPASGRLSPGSGPLPGVKPVRSSSKSSRSQVAKPVGKRGR